MSSSLHVPSDDVESLDLTRSQPGIGELARLRHEVRELRLRNLELNAALALTHRKLSLYKDYEAEVEESLASLVQSILDSPERGSLPTTSPRLAESAAKTNGAEVIEAALVKERNRIAQDIHDGLAQQLTGIVLELEACHRSLLKDPTRSAASVSKAIQTARAALVDVRKYMFGLRTPSATSGRLIISLEGLVAEFEQRHSVPARLKVYGGIKQVSADVEESLLRVAQEALTNVGKHAQAKQVEVSLRFGPSAMELTVYDDGGGFNPDAALARAREEAKLGLVGMQERTAALGGSLQIDSAVGAGTRIIAHLPLSNQAEPAHSRPHG